MSHPSLQCLVGMQKHQTNNIHIFWSTWHRCCQYNFFLHLRGGNRQHSPWTLVVMALCHETVFLLSKKKWANTHKAPVEAHCWAYSQSVFEYHSHLFTSWLAHHQMQPESAVFLSFIRSPRIDVVWFRRIIEAEGPGRERSNNLRVNRPGQSARWKSKAAGK